jgi:hypothetical protein
MWDWDGAVSAGPSEPARWQPYYTKIPRRVNGKWYWFQWIYRKVIMEREDMHIYARYEYGDDFDALKQ